MPRIACALRSQSSLTSTLKLCVDHSPREAGCVDRSAHVPVLRHVGGHDPQQGAALSVFWLQLRVLGNSTEMLLALFPFKPTWPLFTPGPLSFSCSTSTTCRGRWGHQRGAHWFHADHSPHTMASCLAAHNFIFWF